jgi:hypothetical protein
MTTVTFAPTGLDKPDLRLRQAAEKANWPASVTHVLIRPSKAGNSFKTPATLNVIAHIDVPNREARAFEYRATGLPQTFEAAVDSFVRQAQEDLGKTQAEDQIGKALGRRGDSVSAASRGEKAIVMGRVMNERAKRIEKLEALI